MAPFAWFDRVRSQDANLHHGWDTQRIQAALDLPSLGFSVGSPGERGVDAIADGRLSMQQLQQAENAALQALAAAM